MVCPGHFFTIEKIELRGFSEHYSIFSIINFLMICIDASLPMPLIMQSCAAAAKKTVQNVGVKFSVSHHH